MSSRYKPMWRNAFCACVFLLLFNASCGYAQLGIGGGFEYGTGVFINNRVFAGAPSLGISGMLSYAPRESRLFPSLTYLLKTMVVPVNNGYYSGLEDVATVHHFVLNLNYRTTGEPNYYQLFMGIGIAKITPETNLTDMRGNPITLIDTASVSLYPVIQAGGKYMHRILGNSSFYLGLEANLKYIRMRSENVYYLQQGKSSVKATIAGEIIAPAVQIHLDYIFGNEE
jgi:hypothetical protein